MRNRLTGRCTAFNLTCAAAAALAAIAAPGLMRTARAVPVAEGTFTLTDGNASTTFSTANQDGEDSFTVNGVQELSKQWFWYRASYQTSEQSVDTLTEISANKTGNNILNVVYGGAGFDLTFNYLLTGGIGNGAASLAETITYANTSTDQTQAPHLFEYDHFTLDSSNTGNVASITGGNTADQTGPKGTTVEVTASPTPNHFDVDTDGSILTALNDSSPTTLGDNAGPTAPGDAEFAFEWDPTVAAGKSFQISKLKTITPATAVPLPATAWTGLATLAGLGLLRLARNSQLATRN